MTAGRPQRLFTQANLRRAVDTRELARFLISGLTATAGNLTAVRLARLSMSFEHALLVGIAVGATISFILSKLFTFRSRDWRLARIEAVRFILVNGVGSALYWAVSMLFGAVLLPNVMGRSAAELLGTFAGAGTMAVSSYFGHRFFTYREGRARSA